MQITPWIIINTMAQEGLVIANKYKLTRRIGEGSFGEIYSGIQILLTLNLAINLTTKEELAAKLVFITSKKLLGSK